MANNFRPERFYEYNLYNPEYVTSPYYHGAETRVGMPESPSRQQPADPNMYGDRSSHFPYRPNFSADYGRRENPADGTWDLEGRTSLSMPEGGIYGEGLSRHGARPNNHAGKGPKGWARSDERILEQVCDALAMDPYINASEIEVNVKDGIVTLNGKVDHRSTKRRVTDQIEHFSGVRDVDNHLTVDQSFFQQAKEFLTGEPEATPTHRGEAPMRDHGEAPTKDSGDVRSTDSGEGRSTRH